MKYDAIFYMMPFYGIWKIYWQLVSRAGLFLNQIHFSCAISLDSDLVFDLMYGVDY